MADQSTKIDWIDGKTPVSRRFDDPYFSIHSGLNETRHVFLAGNDLPARFADGFHIGELGFGTGLNMLTSWQAWQQAGARGQLNFTSFEAFPMAHADIARALAAFPELADLSAAFLAQWPAADGKIELPGLSAQIITGDARQTLPNWPGMADAWFLDGFSPAKNPELWGEPLMGEVASHTRQGGTFATYSAAGHVRRALGNAGFAVQRVPGYGHKRHMTIGQKAGQNEQ